MSTSFIGKNSYSLIKTNPKLTGNVKLVIDSNEQIYLESIDADKELSLNRYKAVKTNERSNYSTDVYQFFNNGSTPSSLVYKLAQNEEFLSVKNVYAQQYYTQYTQGTYPKISKAYPEQLAYFAPIWLEPNDIPENFVIFKLAEPVSVNTSNTTTAYDDSIEKQIYNADYFNGNDSNYFFETILKNSKIHKVFNLGEDTVIGKYLRNHLEDVNFPESPLTVKYNQSEYTTYNGVSLKNGGFTEEQEESFNDFFVSDKTITEFDNNVTLGFERNNVVSANIINFEFLFDESGEDYEISRYYGFFVNKETISKFLLNGKDFYDKKQQNYKQNKNIITNDQIDIEDSKNFTFQNNDGVKLFIDGLTEYNMMSNDIKQGNYTPYVKGTKNNFYDVNTNTDWGVNEIVLKDTQVDLSEFKGYTEESTGIIPASKLTNSSKGYVEFTINGVLDNVEIRLKSVNEHLESYSILSTFISDSSLPTGTFNSNKFSVAGTIEDIASALTDIINSHSISDDTFALSAVQLGNKVVIVSRVSNDFANTYDWLIYSDDSLPPPITINFNDIEFTDVTTYNNNFRTSTTQFKRYDDVIIDSSIITQTGYIAAASLVGARSNATSRIKVSAEYFSYFNNTRFLKTNGWYSRIKGVYRYIDDAIEQNGKVLEFNDFFSYVVVDIEDDLSVFFSAGDYVYIYDLAENHVGLFSYYPIKQLDTLTFTSKYGKDGDGYINKQLEYVQGIGRQIYDVAELEDLASSITNFSESGFASLISIINEDTNDYTKINNEYDRLKETELPQIATPGRIIPFINKWVFDDDAVDVRENSYRLNTSVGFSFSSFSPSEFYTNADTRYFTHEWYYLQKFPPYLTDLERVNTFSYFREFISYDELTDMSSDKFTPYFIQENVSATVDIPRRVKYSTFANGNDVSHSSTMFRGVKLLVKKRNENQTSLNFNINNIVTYPSDTFNSYKFAAVLTNDTNNALAFKVIENKKYKTITFFIEANLDDYYLTTTPEFNSTTGVGRYLDRSSLYILKDKYSDDGTVADVFLSGAISVFDKNNQPAWTVAGDGTYIIPGTQNSANSSLPDFNTQILPNDSGAYDRIEVNTSKGIIAIDGIKEVNKDNIIASTLLFSNNGGTSFSPINNTYLNIYPNYIESSIVTPVYLGGGFNAFTGIIQNLSFGSIFDKINNGNPDIQYISVDEDASGNKIETRNEFLLEFVKGDINAKATFLKPEPFITNAIKDNDYKPIGSIMTSLNNTYVSPISRVKGNFSPKVNDIIMFNDNHGDAFNQEIRDQLHFKNTQFFPNYPDFALLKEEYINKVNTDNPLTVLELSSVSELKPQWWKIDEVAIDKQDSYIFRSDWDHNYYRKYVNKSNYNSLPGYVEPKDISSKLGSAIMNIPDNINLENFKSIDVSGIGINKPPKSELLYKVYRKSDNTSKIYKIKGRIFTEHKMVNQIAPALLPLFNEYVNPMFNYDDLDTFIDDSERYTKTNILPRYEIDTVEVYGKFIPIGESTIIIEDKYNVQELIQDGFVLFNDVIISGVKSNDYDRLFNYTLPLDKDVILAFVIKIKSD